MNDKQRECAWARINFYIKLFFADLIIFSALASWLAARYEAGVFGLVYWITCATAGAGAIIGACLLWAIIKRFRNMETKSK